MSEPKTAPRLFKQFEVCEELELDPRVFREWGCPVHHTHRTTKFFTVGDIVRAYHKNKTQAHTLSPNGSEPIDYRYEKARLFREQSSRLEMLIQQTNREYAPFEMLDYALSASCLMVHNQVNQLANDLAALPGMPEGAQKLITSALEKALLELADTRLEYPED